jgi:asparagine N-glycosylation enzyme membrane subunit Stt3
VTTRNLWAVVVLVSVVLTSVTVLLALHIDPTAIISLVSVVAVPVIGAVLYGKVETISQQTNGNTSRLTSLVEGMVDHLKTHNTVEIPNIQQADMHVTTSPTDLSEVKNGGTTV